MKTNSVVAVSLTLLLTAAFGLAQVSADRVTAKVPHEFTAAGKLLPAGQYSFTYDADKRFVTIRGAGNEPGVIVPVVTLLAGAMHTTANDAHVVFDKVGNNYYLSEIWIPGIDGIALLTTKEKHEHEIVNVPR